MKQKVLAIAGCIAATAPSASIADVLPEKLIGLNLGEIRSSSFLNQPFKGVIPFLFTSYENSKNLNIKLAPQSIFNEVGAEKHPILNNLSFQVTRQNNKPVILISSDKPINLPFLNFILEIKGPGTLVYQDYTVLLDPESKQQKTAATVNYIDVNNDQRSNALYESYKDVVNTTETTSRISAEQSLRDSGTLLLANLSSEILSTKKQNLKYKVRSGDSLSRIAQRHKNSDVSVKTVSKLIYQKNPKAFIRGNVNRLKKGFTLNLPSDSEIEGFEIARSNPINIKNTKVSKNVSKKITKVINKKVDESNVDQNKIKSLNTYTVAKGDSLSKITKNFAQKDVSFSKMMNTIYSNNPTAFINKSKNKIKAGAKIQIPSFDDLDLNQDQSQNIAKVENTTLPEVKNKKSIKAKPNEGVSRLNNSSSVEINDDPLKDTVVKLQENQYKVVKGDTLSYITNKIGYKDVPFATMLNGIFLKNPDAFEEGRMTNLIAGSVITLPAHDSLEKKIDKPIKLEPKTTVSKIEKSKPVEQVIPKPSPVVVKSDTTISPDLTKRIRELRKELRQAKDNLSDLKSNLNNKELLLEQKNIQLSSLNTMLTKYSENKDFDSKALEVVAIKTSANQVSEESDYKPKSKAEMAKIKRDQFNRKDKTEKQIAKIEEIQNKSVIQQDIDKNEVSTGLFKDYKFSSMLDNVNSNHAYLTLVLLLGLLLIRYRRALYSYTYSKIKYDQPKYYPVPDVDKYDLKEKNINFHDPIMDQETSNFDNFNDDLKEEFVEDVVETKSISIDPNLIEAKEELFETSDEAKHIAHCESLVTELFGDIEDTEDSKANSDWNNIEQFCDSYIDKIKDSDDSLSENGDNAVVDEASDFNNMMTDLLESLDKVDKSVKRNNLNDNELIDSFENDTYVSNKDPRI